MLKTDYQPPFTITPTIVTLVAEISQALGRLSVLHETSISVRLRRVNRTMVHQHQAEYYAALNQSTANASSSVFIEFMLRMIRDAVLESNSASEKKTEKTSEKIIRLIGEDPKVTIADLARMTGLTARSIERNLQVLKAQGLVHRVGPDKGGHWELTKGLPHA